MKLKICLFTIWAVTLSWAWYLVEPHAVTFIDDGPYYSINYSEPVQELSIISKVGLRRFGHLVYELESRQHPDGDNSVLVLKNSEGSVRWARIPIKPDGKLGPIELQSSNVTWDGGWRVRIKPELQEAGFLYLGSFGGFRFFNHSW